MKILILNKKIIDIVKEIPEEYVFMEHYDTVQTSDSVTQSIGDTFNIELFSRTSAREVSIENKKYVKEVQFFGDNEYLLAKGTSRIDTEYVAEYIKSEDKGFMKVHKSESQCKYYYHGEGDMIFYAELETDGIVTDREEYFSAANIEEFCLDRGIENPFPQQLVDDMYKTPEVFALKMLKEGHCFGVSITGSGKVSGYANLTEDELVYYGLL